MDPNIKGEYEFIIGEATKGPLEPQAPNTPNKSKIKLLIFGAIGVVLVLITILLVSLFTGGSDKAALSLIAVARQQTEVIRVAEVGAKKSRDAQNKAFAVTVQSAVKSDNGSLLSYLKANGLPSDSKSIGSSLSAGTTDQTLTQAEQANQFDAVFVDVLTEEISKYQATLQTAYESSESAAAKTLINQFFQNTEFITPKAD